MGSCATIRLSLHCDTRVAEQGHGPRDYLMAVREGGFAPLEAGGALSHCRVFSHMGIHTRTDDAHGVVSVGLKEPRPYTPTAGRVDPSDHPQTGVCIILWARPDT